MQENKVFPGFGRLACAVMFVSSSVMASHAPLAAQPPSPVVEKLLVVDCSLPGQVRRLGRRMTLVLPRRAVRTTGSDCEIRGGEYVSYDRADYRTALEVWLPEAQGGEPKAQTFVGEIYEKGRGGAVDYASAASWYAKAADRGYTPAMINLAHLYDEGLGVPMDKARAGTLLARAANLPQALVGQVKFDPPQPVENPQIALLSAQNAALAQQIAARNSEAERLIQERDRLAAERADLAQQTAEMRARLAVSASKAQLQVTETSEGSDRAKALNSALTQQVVARNAEAEQRIRQLAEERDLLAAERADLARQAAEMRTRLAASTALAQSRSSELSAASDSMKAQSAELARREAALQAREAAMRAEQARLASAKIRLAAAQGAGPTVDLIVPHRVTLRGGSDITVPAPAKTQAIVGRAISADGILTVTINGERQVLTSNGMFNASVDLMPTATPVQIVAIDQQGRSSTTILTLSRAPVAEAVAPRPQPGQPAVERFDPSRIKLGAQHALLIGNSKYLSLPQLTTPRADVDAIAEVLRTRYGFKTTVLYNATRYQMLSALNDLRANLNDGDDLLIYYAGHGQMVSMESRSRGYWLPVDAEENNTANWLSTPDLTDAVATMNVHKVLLVSDSCYSGLLTRGIARLVTGASASERESFLETMAQPRSRNVLTSGGVTPVLDGGGGKHSVFANAFLKVLSENDQPILGQDLATSVQQQVSIGSKAQDFNQVPQYGPLQLAGHESGDYVFVPRNSPAGPNKAAMTDPRQAAAQLASLRR